MPRSQCARPFGLRPSFGLWPRLRAKPEPRAQPKVEAESTAGRSPAAHQAAEPREQSLMQRLSRTRVANTLW